MNTRKIALLLVLLTVSIAFGQQREPEYVYVSNGGVSSFVVDRSTGVLSKLPRSYFPVSGQLEAAPAGHFVFGAGGGINVAKIDPTTGALTAVPGSPFAKSLMYPGFVITPDEHFLFVLSENSLYTFSIDGDIGGLTQMGPPIQLEEDYAYLTVSPSSEFLYVGAFPTEGNPLLGYSIDPKTGELTPFATGAHGAGAVISANGKYLYSMSSINDNESASLINEFSAGSQPGTFNLIPGSPFPAMLSDYGLLTIDPTGSFIYELVSNPPGFGGVAGFLINPVSGAVEAAVPGSPFAVPYGAADDNVMDHSGKFIYTLDGELDTLVEFSLNRATGSLSAIAGTPPEINGAAAIATVAPSADSGATLTSLVIEPVDPTLVSGESSALQFTAAGIYSDGSHRFLTASVTWSSATPSVATISNTPGESGLATVLGSGTTAIGATLNGVSTQTTLTVEAPRLLSIAIAPSAPAIKAGMEIQFTATGTYGDGTMKDITDAVRWASSNGSVAVVSQTGISYGEAAGTATITAISEKVAGTAVLTVIPK